MLITLQNICRASLTQQEAILMIRNQDDIRSMMYTEHVINITEHLAWIEGLRAKSLKDKPTQIAFIILVNNKVAGLISLNAIDYLHKKADLGFYLDKQFRIVSASVEFAIIDFSFNILGLEKLNCEVLEHNNNALKVHRNLGFLDEGFRPDNIKKQLGRVGVHYLGICQKRWQRVHNTIFTKYRIVFDKYKVQIEFS